MCDNRLARPDRQVLPGIITECDDEIELCVFELLPRLAVRVRCVNFEILAENFQRERMRCGFWTRSGWTSPISMPFPSQAMPASRS